MRRRPGGPAHSPRECSERYMACQQTTVANDAKRGCRVHTISPVADPVISVRGLRKSYGDLEAVRGIDLEVAGRQIFAFLGPNGAGKTTTVEVLEGYRDRIAGEVSVLGVDPANAGHDWRQ